MNKTMEYMAFGLPVVAFDLIETRISAQDAAVYADPASGSKGFAETLVRLLDDPAARNLMGKLGRERVEDDLAWAHQAPAYLAVFDELTGRSSARTPRFQREEAR
jgi:glycosyltransferase involved in cell wall biosynthesis